MSVAQTYRVKLVFERQTEGSTPPTVLDSVVLWEKKGWHAPAKQSTESYFIRAATNAAGQALEEIDMEAQWQSLRAVSVEAQTVAEVKT